MEGTPILPIVAATSGAYLTLLLLLQYCVLNYCTSRQQLPPLQFLVTVIKVTEFRDVPDIRFQFRMAGYPAVFLLSGSAPVVPRNRISEPDNSSARMWPINMTKLLVCSGLKPFLA